ncbi:MAG: hypothetical protein Q7S01_01665 [bacterium]|nr:hypothetical protein [bacterium]
MIKKKVTLEVLAARIQKGFASVETKMEKGFSAVAEDIADIKRDIATKEQVVALHTQVQSIETEIRGMRHAKMQSRVTDLEEHAFGKSRA